MHKKTVRPGLDIGMEFGGHEPGWSHHYPTDLFSPYLYADGGEGEDDEDDEEEEDESEEDEDDSKKKGKKDEDDSEEEDEDKDKTPEELSAEVKRLRNAYLKKMRQGKNRSQRIKDLESDKATTDKRFAELEAELKTLRESGGKKGEGEDDEAAKNRINAMLDKAREEGKNSFKPTVIRMAAKTDLMAAGARSSVVDRLVKMIDTDDVDVDDDGEIDVTDQVMQLKKDLPELFGPTRAPRKKPSIKAKDAGGAKGDDKDVKQKKSATQQAADRLRGIRE